MSCRLTNARITRWVLDISQFNIDWQHIRGTDNLIADSLSRMYGTGNDINVHIRTIKANQSLWVNLRKNIIKHQETDKDIQKWLHNNIESTMMDGDGLIKFNMQNQWKIPLPSSITQSVIEFTHEFLLHAGHQKITKLI